MSMLPIPAMTYAAEPPAALLPLGADAFPGLARPPAANPPAYVLPKGAFAQAIAVRNQAPRTGQEPERPGISAQEMEGLFRGLVREYGASLYYFVLKRVGHADDAAEIAQQAFVEAACSITSFRGEAELSTWVFGIAVNLSRNHISRAPKHRHHFESDEVLTTCESPDLQPCEALSQRQGLALVSEAMDQLPADMAEALNLVTIEDLSYEEAAERLNVPVGTVRSRVSRARSAVRKHLQAAGYLDRAA